MARWLWSVRLKRQTPVDTSPNPMVFGSASSTCLGAGRWHSLPMLGTSAQNQVAAIGFYIAHPTGCLLPYTKELMLSWEINLDFHSTSNCETRMNTSQPGWSASPSLFLLIPFPTVRLKAPLSTPHQGLGCPVPGLFRSLALFYFLYHLFGLGFRCY